MKYTYYKTCECCGAHLDPAEKCDCEKKGILNAEQLVKVKKAYVFNGNNTKKEEAKRT